MRLHFNFQFLSSSRRQPTALTFFSPTKPRKYRVGKRTKEFTCGRPPESSSTSTVEERPKISHHENKNLLAEFKLAVEEEARDNEDRIKAEYMEARERMAREIIAIEMKEKLAQEATTNEREAKEIVVREMVPKKRVILEKAVKENQARWILL